jgi:hypothetical protein
MSLLPRLVSAGNVVDGSHWYVDAVHEFFGMHNLLSLL